MQRGTPLLAQKLSYELSDPQGVDVQIPQERSLFPNQREGKL
jgi:hypothetical protein